MNRRAFTLIELLVALAIIGIIVVSSMVAVGSLNDERRLREPLNELRMMAKRSWGRSMEEQRAWQIRLMPQEFILEPKQPINMDDLKLFTDADAKLNRGNGVTSYKIDPEIRMEVRHWGEPQWHSPGPDAWVFEHSGLCEPINIRFISAFGTVQVSFDPLTADVVNEEFLAAGERP
jgi:prepilin-type N-terminal cleavage/methylation domain-containing protein